MDKNYLLNFTIPEHITHVKIDIGLGMHNVNSIVYLREERNLLVYMFEPNIDCIVSSEKNMKESNIHSTNIYNILPVALSDIETPKTIDFYNMLSDGGTSSIYEPIDNNLGEIKEKITVPCFSLKHFFDVFPWDRFPYIEHIKIDAQGADFDIIKSAGYYLSERVVCITAEPESKQYKDCGNNTEEHITEYLYTQNFIKVKYLNTRDPTFVNKKFFNLINDIFIYQQ